MTFMLNVGDIQLEERTKHVLLAHGVLEENDGCHNDDDPLQAISDRVRHRRHPLQDHIGHLQASQCSWAEAEFGPPQRTQHGVGITA